MEHRCMQNAVSHDEERQWVLLSQQGDGLAFENLVRKYQHDLLSIVHWHFGYASDAEDVLQMILCKVYFSLDVFDRNRPFLPWLRRIAINQCYDERRRARRRKILTFTELGLQDSSIANTTAHQTPFSRVAAEEGTDLHALLHKMLDKLPERQRKVVVLRDIQQVPYEQLAEILGCTQQAARIKVCRARIRLKKLMTRAIKLSEMRSQAPKLRRREFNIA